MSALVLTVIQTTHIIKTMIENLDTMIDMLKERIGVEVEDLQQDSGQSTTSGNTKPKKKRSSKSKKNTLTNLIDITNNLNDYMVEDAVYAGKMEEEQSDRCE